MKPKASWVNVCLKNKLIIYIGATLLCLLGLFCLLTVPISPFPEVPFNNLVIHVNYSGASATTVEIQVTSKLVNALQGTENIKDITGVSRPGKSVIGITLNSADEKSVLQTKMDVMEAINSSHLPAAVDQPEIKEAASRSSLISFVVSSNSLSLFELANFTQSQLYPKFIRLPGVDVHMPAEDPIVRIKLDPGKLAKHKLDLLNISELINSSNQEKPLGELYIKRQPYTLGIQNRTHTLNQIENLIIAYDGAEPIYVKDIAQVSFEPVEIIPSIYTSFNGKPAITAGLYTKSSANPFAISAKTRSDIAQVKQSLQKNISITPIFDRVKDMKTSIHEVLLTIFIASILVLLIALMFLGRFSTTIIPIITIPICLLGTILILNLIGYSINVITLLALVIAVGLVVDDAIVVVENITRYLEQGHSKHQAVIQGTQDISLTIIGLTLTLLAAYLPIVLCDGPFIILLKNFAIPLACAVFISGIVALTLTPVMSIYLVSDKKVNTYQVKFDKALKTVIRYYHRSLKQMLNRPYRSIILIIILIIGSSFAALNLPEKFYPEDPNGSIRVTFTNNGDDTVDSLKEKSRLFQQFYQAPTVNYYSLDIRNDKDTGRLNGELNINYKDKYLHQTVLFAKQINAFIKEQAISHVSASIQKYSRRGDDPDFSVRLINTENNIVYTNKVAQKLTKTMEKSLLFSSLFNSINLPQKQLQFEINTVKAAKFGIYQSDISKILSIYYGGYRLDNNFSIDGLSVPITLQLDNEKLKDPKSINDIQIQSPTTHEFYPLSNFVKLKAMAKPIMIDTFNGHPYVDIEGTLNPNIPLAQAIAYFKQIVQQSAPTMQYQFIDSTADYLEGNSQRNLIILLGMLSIYFLLAILFNSLVDPFIILLTVPFSILGGAISLYFIGGSINLYSTLGLITLIGLITKHGVLIVQFANQELKKNNNLHAAILLATQQRFRPIIMTTLAMALGALPLVFSTHLMYVARRELGAVVIGGLTIGTVFSLFIVPLVYSLAKPKDGN